MASALIYLAVVLAVAAVIYLLGSVVFGRGEELEVLRPGTTPTRLPSAEVQGHDVRGLTFQQAFRGYKTAEVDWALERLAGEVDELRGRVATLERQLEVAGEQLQQEHAEPTEQSPAPAELLEPQELPEPEVLPEEEPPEQPRQQEE